jgi:hypothetical protein
MKRWKTFMTNQNFDQEYQNAWGAVDNDQQGNSGGGNPERPSFLQLDIGDTVVRVLDMIPHSYKEWYIPAANGGQGSSVGYFGEGDLLEKANKAHMSKVFKEADKKGLKDKARKDFLRDYGYKKQPFGKVKEKHIIHVLDRATGEIKLLDKGNGVFKGIKKFAMNPKFGDPRMYDITITMEGDKADFQTIEYTVMPDPIKEEITEAERKLYEEKKIDLVKFKTPNYTPEQALMIAKGATWADVLGDGSDSAEEASEKADDSMLPESKTEETPQKEEKPQDVEKGEALTEDELNNMEF